MASSASGGGGGGGGSASATAFPPVGNTNADFIEQFGKNIPLRPNVKAQLFNKAKIPEYSEEENSSSKFIPIKIVDEAIRSQNLTEIVELLTLARFLKSKSIQVITEDFLSINTNPIYNRDQRVKYRADRRRWKYQQEHPLNHSYRPFYNYNNKGGLVPSMTEPYHGANGVEFMRVIPEYEMLGPTGYYNEGREAELLFFKPTSFFEELRRRQALLVSYIKAEDSRMFDPDLYMGLVSTDKIIVSRDLFDYLYVIIARLEKAKVELINYFVSIGRADKIEELIALRKRNLDNIGYQNLTSVAAKIMSSNDDEEKARLHDILQPHRLPKILDNLNKLRGLKQNASKSAKKATHKGGRRHPNKRRQTARK